MPEETAVITTESAAGTETTTGTTAEAKEATLLLDEATPQEAKTEGEGQTENTDAKPPEGAPEKYELALPEGFKLDETTFAKFEPLARKYNLTNEDASAFAALHAEVISNVMKEIGEARASEVKGWAEATRNDPDIGGKNLDKSIELGEKALRKYGTESLFADLKSTGLANHPEFIRFCAKLGAAMSEDTHVQGGAANQTKTDLAHQLYPNLK